MRGLFRPGSRLARRPLARYHAAAEDFIQPSLSDSHLSRSRCSIAALDDGGGPLPLLLLCLPCCSAAPRCPSLEVCAKLVKNEMRRLSFAGAHRPTLVRPFFFCGKALHRFFLGASAV